ncbi:uncharacterized protein [Heterodontus francisci]|uniref:uncharacterized protein n=1 Tax=Heterodontus francisci TaxID=7792 RepID=UPI00355B069D
MAPPLIMGPETWSLSSGLYPEHLGLFFTLSLLLLILLLISCGNCMRKTAKFSTESNYMESKGNSQLIRISQLEDPKYPKIISKATIKKGAPQSRRVSWQNDMHVTGTQLSRPLPEIPSASLSKEDLEGKGDPVYQTASELAAATCLHMGEDPIEPPYAASNQFSLETPKAEFIIENEVGKEVDGKAVSQPEKVTPVYARVSKKPKKTSLPNLPVPSSPHENVECEEEPPPIPERHFGDDDDVVVSESSENKTLEQFGWQVCTALDEASKGRWVPGDSSINEGDQSVPTQNGITVGKHV